MRRLLAVFLALATPAAAQDPLSGAWTGSYTCGQGVTGLTLHLDRAGPELRGVFHFYPLPENPLAAEGCFEMTGGTDPADRWRGHAGGRIHRRRGRPRLRHLHVAPREQGPAAAARLPSGRRLLALTGAAIPPRRPAV